jgi:hypothetical protein
VSLAADGVTHPVLGRTRIGVQLDRCQWAHSASSTAAMACDDVWYHGYHVSWTRQKGIGGPTMSRPTQPMDMVQEAHS